MIASSSLCAKHHIQKIHSSSLSTNPFRPLPATFAAAPSVTIPTSLLHPPFFTDWIPRHCSPYCSDSRRPCAVTLCGLCSDKKLILVWNFSSTPLASHQRTTKSSLSVLLWSVETSIRRGENWHWRQLKANLSFSIRQ